MSVAVCNIPLCCRAWAAAVLGSVAAVRATAPLQQDVLAFLVKLPSLRHLAVGTLRSIHRDVYVSIDQVSLFEKPFL